MTSLFRSLLFWFGLTIPFDVIGWVLGGWMGALLAFLIQITVLGYAVFRIEELWISFLRAELELPDPVTAALKHYKEKKILPGTFLSHEKKSPRIACFEDSYSWMIPVHAPGRPGLVLISRGAITLLGRQDFEESLAKAIETAEKSSTMGVSFAAYLIERWKIWGIGEYWRKTTPHLTPFRFWKELMIFPVFHWVRTCFSPLEDPDSSTLLGRPHRPGLELLTQRDKSFGNGNT